MDEQFSYEGLYRLLEERRAKRPEGSYTTYLFEKGLDKILKKVGRGVHRGYHRGQGPGSQGDGL